MSVLIVKADGTREPFRIQKLRRSLKRAGASKKEVAHISGAIEKEIISGMSTAEIYRRAFEMLRGSEYIPATRYSLRRALFGLGPTGFPFEDFLARLFEHEGYEVKLRQEMRGRCATHELDLIASKTNDCFIAEAKFHARPGIKSDLQVALYSYARFSDLEGKKLHRHMCSVVSSVIVTNTKFTSVAVDYARCAGLDLLSWDYPKDNNLQRRIERAGLYPITVLQSLANRDKRVLLENGVVLCREIMKNEDYIKSLGISRSKVRAAVEESEQICESA